MRTNVTSSSLSLKTKFVEATLVAQLDKYYSDLQMTRKKTNGKLMETQSDAYV